MIYAGYLPPVELNRRYVEKLQLPRYLAGQQPVKVWHSNEKDFIEGRAVEKPEVFTFSRIGRKCMGMEEW